ncbi:MAG: hypothetical protein WCD75_21565 [Rhodoplanes sp.]
MPLTINAQDLLAGAGLRVDRLGFRACEHDQAPFRSVLVKPQNVQRAIASLEFAIAVIGTEPLIEDFDDLDFARVQTESPRHSQAVNLIRLDLDTHVFVWRGAALASGVSYARKN